MMTSFGVAPASTVSIWFQPSVDAAANFSLLPFCDFQVAIQSSAVIGEPSFQTAFGFSFRVTTRFGFVSVVADSR